MMKGDFSRINIKDGEIKSEGKSEREWQQG